MAAFDFNTISDEAIRTEYRHILLRGQAIADAAVATYRPNGNKIEVSYVSEQAFNAYARPKDQSYAIEIDSSIVLFNLILFSKLMTDSQMLPYLGEAKQLESDYQLPFIIDPIDFDERANWKIELDKIRSFAAGTMADICSTFVICHEVGHVMSGHIEGLQAYEGKDVIAEMASFVSMPQKTKERRKAWEADADSIACGLLINFIAELFEDTRKNPRTAKMFGADEQALANILAISLSALFAFFCYVRGVRNHLNLSGHHPHPMVRSYHVRDMLLAHAFNRWDIDQDQLLEILDLRFGETLDCLNKIGLFDGRIYTEAYMDEVEADLAHLGALQARYRSTCRQWAWISWG